MQGHTKIVIGIQARTTSTRFPNKVLEQLGPKKVIYHVIEACQQAARYLNRLSEKRKLIVDVAMCIPEGDPIRLALSPSLTVVEGHEHDVLSRYALLSRRTGADYVVRITGDCPMIPAFLINKHIMTAVMNQYDYVSNVDEQCRTAADGWDCEVISARALDYADQSAVLPADREHVTTLLRREPPNWLKSGMIVGFLNLSAMKLSLDTPEDLERIRKEYAAVEQAEKTAEKIYGRRNVHHF